MAVKFLHIGAVLVVLMLVMAVNAGEEHDDDDEGEDDPEKVHVETLVPAPEGCTRVTKRHDQLSMHYVGTLTETGTKFDSSHDREQPFTFQLGAGQVIKGWDEGLMGMCVGEKRKLIIPSSKGYGAGGAGELIPPNAGLTFEVELVGIEDGNSPPNVFKQIDLDKDLQLSQEEVLQYLQKQEGAGRQDMQDSNQREEILNQIFSHEDKDKDGFISHEEFSGPKHDEL